MVNYVPQYTTRHSTLYVNPPKRTQNIVFPSQPSYDVPITGIWGAKSGSYHHLQFVLSNGANTGFKVHD